MMSGRRTIHGGNPSVRRLRRRRRHSGLLMLLAVLAAASLIIYGNVFVLKEIVVNGAIQKEASEIAGMSGLKLGMSIFEIDEKAVKRNISSDKYVEVTTVETKLPDTVIITIRERVPAAAVNCAGVILLVDEQGYILERLTSVPSDRDIVVISGMDVSLNAQGSMIESGVIGQKQTTKKVLEAIRLTESGKLLSELNVANLDNLYLVSKTGVQILLGDDSVLNDKLKWMQIVLERLTENGVTSGILDVSSGKNAVFSDR